MGGEDDLGGASPDVDGGGGRFGDVEAVGEGEEGEGGFFVAGDDFEGEAGLLLDERDEALAVGGVADGRGGDGANEVDVVGEGSGAEAGEGFERCLDAKRVEFAGGGEVLGELGGLAILGEGGEAAGVVASDEESDGVAPDVDGSDAEGFGRGSGTRGHGAWDMLPVGRERMWWPSVKNGAWGGRGRGG